MKLPVDLLSTVDQETLEQSAKDYMSRLLYRSPDTQEYLSLSDSRQIHISLCNVGFAPLYGNNIKQKVLAVFPPEAPHTAVGFYLLGQWWSVQDILKTSDPTREGLLKVRSTGERIVLYVLNRIVYRAHEMGSDDSPFLCHAENDTAKILWKDGEAIGFYSIKPEGSLCSNFLTQCYQLPIMDTIFVRKMHRGHGHGLRMLEDFVDSFKNNALGLKYPLSTAMYKVCAKYLSSYPADADLLWEVEGVGGPFQRTQIASKIQTMALKGKHFAGDSWSQDSNVNDVPREEENAEVQQNTGQQTIVQQTIECTMEVEEEVVHIKVTKETEDTPVTARSRSSHLKRRWIGSQTEEVMEENLYEKIKRVEDIEAGVKSSTAETEDDKGTQTSDEPKSKEEKEGQNQPTWEVVVTPVEVVAVKDLSEVNVPHNETGGLEETSNEMDESQTNIARHTGIDEVEVLKMTSEIDENIKETQETTDSYIPSCEKKIGEVSKKGKPRIEKVKDKRVDVKNSDETSTAIKKSDRNLRSRQVVQETPPVKSKRQGEILSDDGKSGQMRKKREQKTPKQRAIAADVAEDVGASPTLEKRTSRRSQQSIITPTRKSKRLSKETVELSKASLDTEDKHKMETAEVIESLRETSEKEVKGKISVRSGVKAIEETTKRPYTRRSKIIEDQVRPQELGNTELVAETLGETSQKEEPLTEIKVLRSVSKAIGTRRKQKYTRKSKIDVEQDRHQDKAETEQTLEDQKQTDDELAEDNIARAEPSDKEKPQGEEDDVVQTLHMEKNIIEVKTLGNLEVVQGELKETCEDRVGVEQPSQETVEAEEEIEGEVSSAVNSQFENGASDTRNEDKLDPKEPRADEEEPVLPTDAGQELLEKEGEDMTEGNKENISEEKEEEKAEALLCSSENQNTDKQEVADSEGVIQNDEIDVEVVDKGENETVNKITETDDDKTMSTEDVQTQKKSQDVETLSELEKMEGIELVAEEVPDTVAEERAEDNKATNACQKEQEEPKGEEKIEEGTKEIPTSIEMGESPTETTKKGELDDSEEIIHESEVDEGVVEQGLNKTTQMAKQGETTVMGEAISQQAETGCVKHQEHVANIVDTMLSEEKDNQLTESVPQGSSEIAEVMPVVETRALRRRTVDVTPVHQRKSRHASKQAKETPTEENDQTEAPKRSLRSRQKGAKATPPRRSGRLRNQSACDYPEKDDAENKDNDTNESEKLLEECESAPEKMETFENQSTEKSNEGMVELKDEGKILTDEECHMKSATEAKVVEQGNSDTAHEDMVETTTAEADIEQAESEDNCEDRVEVELPSEESIVEKGNDVNEGEVTEAIISVDEEVKESQDERKPAGEDEGNSKEPSADENHQEVVILPTDSIQELPQNDKRDEVAETFKLQKATVVLVDFNKMKCESAVKEGTAETEVQRNEAEEQTDELPSGDKAMDSSNAAEDTTADEDTTKIGEDVDKAYHEENRVVKDQALETQPELEKKEEVEPATDENVTKETNETKQEDEKKIGEEKMVKESKVTIEDEETEEDAAGITDKQAVEDSESNIHKGDVDEGSVDQALPQTIQMDEQEKTPALEVDSAEQSGSAEGDAMRQQEVIHEENVTTSNEKKDDALSNNEKEKVTKGDAMKQQEATHDENEAIISDEKKDDTLPESENAHLTISATEERDLQKSSGEKDSPVEEPRVLRGRKVEVKSSLQRKSNRRSKQSKEAEEEENQTETQKEMSRIKSTSLRRSRSSRHQPFTEESVTKKEMAMDIGVGTEEKVEGSTDTNVCHSDKVAEEEPPAEEKRSLRKRDIVVKSTPRRKYKRICKQDTTVDNEPEPEIDVKDRDTSCVCESETVSSAAQVTEVEEEVEHGETIAGKEDPPDRNVATGMEDSQEAILDQQPDETDQGEVEKIEEKEENKTTVETDSQQEMVTIGTVTDEQGERDDLAEVKDSTEIAEQNPIEEGEQGEEKAEEEQKREEEMEESEKSTISGEMESYTTETNKKLEVEHSDAIQKGEMDEGVAEQGLQETIKENEPEAVTEENGGEIVEVTKETTDSKEEDEKQIGEGEMVEGSKVTIVDEEMGEDTADITDKQTVEDSELNIDKSDVDEESVDQTLTEAIQMDEQEKSIALEVDSGEQSSSPDGDALRQEATPEDPVVENEKVSISVMEEQPPQKSLDKEEDTSVVEPRVLRRRTVEVKPSVQRRSKRLSKQSKEAEEENQTEMEMEMRVKAVTEEKVECSTDANACQNSKTAEEAPPAEEKRSLRKRSTVVKSPPRKKSKRLCKQDTEAVPEPESEADLKEKDASCYSESETTSSVVQMTETAEEIEDDAIMTGKEDPLEENVATGIEDSPAAFLDQQPDETDQGEVEKTEEKEENETTVETDSQQEMVTVGTSTGEQKERDDLAEIKDADSSKTDGQSPVEKEQGEKEAEEEQKRGEEMEESEEITTLGDLKSDATETNKKLEMEDTGDIQKGELDEGVTEQGLPQTIQDDAQENTTATGGNRGEQSSLTEGSTIEQEEREATPESNVDEILKEGKDNHLTENEDEKSTPPSIEEGLQKTSEEEEERPVVERRALRRRTAVVKSTSQRQSKRLPKQDKEDNEQNEPAEKSLEEEEEPPAEEKRFLRKRSITVKSTPKRKSKRPCKQDTKVDHEPEPEIDVKDRDTSCFNESEAISSIVKGTETVEEVENDTNMISKENLVEGNMASGTEDDKEAILDPQPHETGQGALEKMEEKDEDETAMEACPQQEKENIGTIDTLTDEQGERDDLVENKDDNSTDTKTQKPVEEGEQGEEMTEDMNSEKPQTGEEELVAVEMPKETQEAENSQAEEIGKNLEKEDDEDGAQSQNRENNLEIEGKGNMEEKNETAEGVVETESEQKVEESIDNKNEDLEKEEADQGVETPGAVEDEETEVPDRVIDPEVIESENIMTEENIIEGGETELNQSVETAQSEDTELENLQCDISLKLDEEEEKENVEDNSNEEMIIESGTSQNEGSTLVEEAGEEEGVSEDMSPSMAKRILRGRTVTLLTPSQKTPRCSKRILQEEGDETVDESDNEKEKKKTAKGKRAKSNQTPTRRSKRHSRTRTP